MKRVRCRERDVPANGCRRERTRIVIGSRPDPGTGGRAARCGAARKDLDNDHASAAARTRRAMIGNLKAGVCAPSGGNMQRWRFLVIRDPKVKETVGALYKRAWDEQVAPRYRSGEPAPGTSRERFERMVAAAEYLANHIHEVPVWIVPCLEGATPTRTSGSSIYPAVQNMLLAARALGLGATLTTLYLQFEKEAEAALGLPPNVHSYALLPIGYPMGRFGPVRRVPLADVVYENRWGQAYGDL